MIHTPFNSIMIWLLPFKFDYTVGVGGGGRGVALLILLLGFSTPPPF